MKKPAQKTSALITGILIVLVALVGAVVLFGNISNQDSIQAPEQRNQFSN